ncbi:MAG: NUDIX domain-containing protein [Phenylobacterium sp.]|jgi:8-oxo-dGTP pyrophosphatase MutT (NUDIX family)
MAHVAAMRERLTARVLLFDPADRLLLMKGRLPSDPAGPGAWFTIGGGAEPGESVREAAAREVVEETGFAGVELGPVIWRRTATYRMAEGEPVLFLEHYFVARCAGGEPCRDAWQAHEHELVDDIRWWALPELIATPEPVYPRDIRRLAPDAAAGRWPTEPLIIR